jgi:polyhydroxyalkanoate synthesis regulator phasin
VEEGDLSEDEADKQHQELLEETLEIEEEPLPQSALRTVKISVVDLNTLDWMIADAEDDTTAE